MQFSMFNLLMGKQHQLGAIVLMRMRAELARNKVEARLKRMAAS